MLIFSYTKKGPKLEQIWLSLKVQKYILFSYFKSFKRDNVNKLTSFEEAGPNMLLLFRYKVCKRGS